MSIIDIGANVGDSVAIIRAVTSSPVLCIEGDPQFFSLLDYNSKQWSDVEVVQAFVGPEGWVSGGLSYVSADGTGGFRPSESNSSTVRLRTLASIVVEHAEIASRCKLVKVDTDGFDTLILRSSVDFLTECMPTILMEYDPHLLVGNDPDAFQIFETLRSIGYGHALIYDNWGRLLLSVNAMTWGVLEDLHAYYSLPGTLYCDICLVPSAEVILASDLVAQEEAHRRRLFA